MTGVFRRRLFVETLIGRLLLGMLLLAGVMAYNNMARENFPDLEIPQALVSTYWPGAAPDQIEKSVTKHLEDEIVSINGLKSYTSGSYNSYSIIAVEFDADMNLSDSMQLLRAAVDKAAAEFPSGAGIEKSSIEEMAVTNMPVVTWSLSGSVDDMLISDSAKRLEKALEALPLVKKVNISGLREKSLHIRLHHERLRELGISPITVRDRIQSANNDMAWGEFEAEENTYNLYLAGRFETVEQLRQLPIGRLENQRPVRLEEVAEVNLQLDKEKSRSFFSIEGGDYRRGVTLDVLKRPGADSLAVIASTQALIDQWQQQQDWPRGLKITRLSDDGELIELAFNDISSSMMQAVVIVFLVLMLLLSWREALIAGFALPVTMLAVLAIMGLLGYSFNSMIMIGMVLALGLMVDVYILVMEGMHDNYYVRKQPYSTAVLSTVKQFFLPAAAGQLTTILAMLPMMMIGGIDGKFIRILPITITVSLLVSLLVAFAICLPLSRYLLENTESEKELYIDKLAREYRQRVQHWLMTHVVVSRRRAGLWVSGAIGLFIGSIFIAGLLPSQMYAETDDRKIGVAIVLPPDATLEQSQRVADKVSVFLQRQPWIEKSVAYVGAKSPMTTGSLKDALLPSEAWNQVGFSLTLLPKHERQLLSFEYLDGIRSGILDATADEPGLQLRLVHIGGDPGAEAPIQIDFIGDDYQQLADIAAEAKRRLAGIAGTVDIDDNLGPMLNEIRFTLDAEMLNFHGIDEQDMAQQIRIAMEEDKIGEFKVEGIDDDPKIRLSVHWPSRGNEQGGPKNVAELELLQIITPDGQSVPMLDLAEYTIANIPRVLVHKEGQRSVTVNARVEGRTVGEILTDFVPELEAMSATWPAEYYYQLAGEVEKSDNSFGQMGVALIAALVLIFVLLALIFNSFAQPLIILAVVPLAMIGTFLGFFLTGTIMSFSGMIGVVSLAGIAVNNGIVLVDTINRNRAKGMAVAQAASLGAAERLRPILSTSLTTILSLLPLAFTDPSWYPLCMAIIYGMIASTMIAILIVPALYLLMTNDDSQRQVQTF
ncbi:Swarming motility protein SwrC [Sinobacterium norvegicum]|uniref:Swarming motility protein SwrC n=1 Tax=Sinobacterium norvegicum TaxID=1641715 RepID=A0ABN8ELA5_9GAMM|nr:efflux RND transporter permease subunit [Sinobacterium norvegicum]CAH0992468.1 Swarming motility protein SwrC [Sinobacterium norvegicum]